MAVFTLLQPTEAVSVQPWELLEGRICLDDYEFAICM